MKLVWQSRRKNRGNPKKQSVTTPCGVDKKSDDFLLDCHDLTSSNLAMTLVFVSGCLKQNIYAISCICFCAAVFFSRKISSVMATAIIEPNNHKPAILES